MEKGRGERERRERGESGKGREGEGERVGRGEKGKGRVEGRLERRGKDEDVSEGSQNLYIS